MSEAEQASPPSKEPKVIKRYTNRKLYDTVESRYVTLDEIAAMIKEGVEVRIVDNRTKEDLTSVTLAQIIFEEEKKKNQMPLAVLREIIRHPGESISGFIQKEVTPRVASIREEAESRIAPILLSFMSESRRLSNARMKRELRVRLRYPTPATLLGEIARREPRRQLALPL